jgi:hypothetical protein
MGIAFGFASSRLGSSTLRTPSTRVAATFDTSMFAGSANER